MPKVTLYNMEGSEAGDIELKDEIFGIEPNQNAVHEVVKNYLANQRQGNQSTKTRAEVRGGGAKPYRQKGTGRARQGSRVAPNHVGGGVVFAPKPRDYRYSVPKKVKRLAMLSILSSKVQENEIIVVDEIAFEEPKTKDMVKFLSAVNAEGKAIIVTADKNETVVKSAANIPGVATSYVGRMNVYELINHTTLIVTEETVRKIEEVYSA